MPSARPAIDELQRTLDKVPGIRRPEILARVTDLFLHGAEAYSSEHVALFDDVMGHMVGAVSRPALTDLSRRLAPVVNAPAGVINFLAGHHDIEVAGPVLRLSDVVTDEVLAEVAGRRNAPHIVAIAERKKLTEQVTRLLVDVGNAEIALKILGNENAQFSELVFARLINRARNNKRLAAVLADRKDIPQELQPFLDLALGLPKRTDADAPEVQG